MINFFLIRKVIKKYNKNDQTIQKEISILHKENFNCAFIIKCFDSFTTQLDFFAVFEYHQVLFILTSN